MQDSFEHVQKRKILKKVRRGHLNRTPSDQRSMIVPIPRYVKASSFNTIDAYFTLVEKNRKLYFGVHYTQSNFNIANISIDENLWVKTVTVNLQEKTGSMIVPFENSIRRLESYGDLDLATVGWKIRKHKDAYPAKMEHYYEMIRTGDPNFLANLRKARNRAILTAKEIESKYIFKKVQSFLNKDSVKLLSVTYSKQIIEQVGYSMDEFVDWVKLNGLPCIFKGSNALYQDLLRSTLDFDGGNQIVVERPEFVVSIRDAQGIKKKVVAQNISIMEPAPEGIFVSGYIVIKSVQESKKKFPWEDVGESHLKMVKSPVEIKDINEIEIKSSTMNDEKVEENDYL